MAGRISVCWSIGLIYLNRDHSTTDWGEDRLRGEGTIEYFRPDRLGVRPFRPFVRFRVRRRDLMRGR